MPSLPEYGQLKVGTTPMPGVQAPASAFGVPHALDLGGVGRTVSDFAAEAKQHADQIAVSDADAGTVRDKTAALWDAQHGAMNARGKDAIPAADAAQDWFQQQTQAREESLSNDVQKEAYRRRVNMHYADLGNQLGQHVGNQIKQYDTDTTEGHVDAFADAALKSFSDENTVQQSVDGTRATLVDFWKRNGHGEGAGVDDFAKQHIADRISAIRATVLKQYATAGQSQQASQYASAGQSQQASQYFDAHKDELTGKDLVAAQKLVKVGTSQSEGNRLARQILGIGQPDPLPGDPPRAAAKTMTEALTQAEKIGDDDQRDEATKAIVAHFTHLETAGRLDRESALTRLTAKMEQSGGRLNKADPDFQSLVGHHEEELLLHHQDQILRPPKDPGDPEGFMTKMQMAVVSPEARKLFMQETLKDWDGMNTSQKMHLMNLQKQYKAADEHVGNKAITDATSEALHWQHVAETEGLKGPDADQDKIRQATSYQHDAELEAARLRHEPMANDATIPFLDFNAKPTSSGNAPAGNVDFRAANTRAPAHAPAPHAAPLPPAVPVTHPTRQMLEESAQSPEYAAALRRLGVLIPAVLPAPVQPTVKK